MSRVIEKKTKKKQKKKKNVKAYANNNGSAQPVHPHSFAQTHAVQSRKRQGTEKLQPKT